MLIGARQECVAGGQNIPEKMAILARFGYDFLELALTREQIAGLGPDSHVDYAAAIANTGLPILSTSMGFGNFAASSPEERAATVANLRAVLEFTRAIGADAMLLATTEQSANTAEYAGVYREALLPVAEEAASLGVMLALEHVGWYKPATLARLVRAIDHPSVRIYFDMGNCLYVGENPLEQARMCAPLTGQLHIKGGPVAPLAALPLVALREILEQAGFQGRGCLEIDSGKDERPLAEARGLLKMAGYWHWD
jgi:sugar phosphate isomerase/epimerase